MEAGGSKDSSSSSDIDVTLLVDASQPSQPAATKRRGRPPGSKNKPKQPAATAVVAPPLAPQPALRHFALEVPPGADVTQSILNFPRGGAHNSLAVLSASGAVTNVTVRSGGMQFYGLPGVLSLMSLSGYLLPRPDGRSFALSAVLSGPNGQVMGGVVSGQVTAVTRVVVIIAAFESPSFIRFPLVADNANRRNSAENEGAGMLIDDPTPAANGCQQVMTTPDFGGRWGPPSCPPY